MNMIPGNSALSAVRYEEAVYPGKTYALDLENGRIAGMTDGLAAVKQAVYKILHTERYTCAAYSFNYGVELRKLIGKSVHFALPEIRRCITEALTWDSRIRSVDSFEFDVRGNDVHVTFTVHSTYGEITEETEVMI